jgi:hypothetical protein
MLQQSQSYRHAFYRRASCFTGFHVNSQNLISCIIIVYNTYLFALSHSSLLFLMECEGLQVWLRRSYKLNTQEHVTNFKGGKIPNSVVLVAVSSSITNHSLHIIHKQRPSNTACKNNIWGGRIIFTSPSRYIAHVLFDRHNFILNCVTERNLRPRRRPWR